MIESENLTLEASPAPAEPCAATFNPLHCMAGELDLEHRFLAIVILSLAVTTCALCVLVCVLTMLVHKISATWMKAVLGKALDKGDPNDNPRKGLLEGRIKSSFAGPSSKAEGKKSKKASFAEDTSCAPARDIDEEDL
jgi:hypothetical protein